MRHTITLKEYSWRYGLPLDLDITIEVPVVQDSEELSYIEEVLLMGINIEEYLDPECLEHLTHKCLEKIKETEYYGF